MGPLVGDEQRPLELAGVLGVDAEVGGQLHRAAHPLRHVAEGPVAEHRRVQGRVEVVGVGDHRADVLAHQVRMLADGFRERAEDDAELPQLLLEGRGHGDGVEDRVDGHARKELLLLERDAQLLERGPDLGIDLVHAGQLLLRFRRRIVAERLEVDGRVGHVRPGRLDHGCPGPERPEAPLQHPLGFALARGNGPDDVFVQAFRQGVGLDLGHEAVLVFLCREFLDGLGRGAHGVMSPAGGAVGIPLMPTKSVAIQYTTPKVGDQGANTGPAPDSRGGIGRSAVGRSEVAFRGGFPGVRFWDMAAEPSFFCTTPGTPARTRPGRTRDRALQSEEPVREVRQRRRPAALRGRRRVREAGWDPLVRLPPDGCDAGTCRQAFCARRAPNRGPLAPAVGRAPAASSSRTSRIALAGEPGVPRTVPPRPGWWRASGTGGSSLRLGAAAG